jgi:hypothetical protein
MYFGLLIISCIAFFVFYEAFYLQVWQTHGPLRGVSDLPGHAQIVLTSQNSGQFPVYSLWYRLVNIISGFSTHYTVIAFISIFLLTFFVAVKYMITYSILSINNRQISALFVAIALSIAMPILSYYTKPLGNQIAFINNFHVYLGNISPNQWHNSTLILAMPFNLLLFYFTVKHIKSNQLSAFLIMGILSIISILCKPNYSLAFLPVLCAYILLLNYKEKGLLVGIIKTSLIAIPSILILLYQWYFTFRHNGVFVHPTKTIFAPFLVWGSYTPHIFISLVLSLAFPLITTILYFKKVDLYLFLSWAVFLLALLIFSLLAEYPTYGDGNYEWGAIAANYILFLFSARLLLQQTFDWKAKIAFMTLGLHTLSGIFFFSYFFVYKVSLIF